MDECTKAEEVTIPKELLEYYDERLVRFIFTEFLNPIVHDQEPEKNRKRFSELLLLLLKEFPDLKEQLHHIPDLDAKVIMLMNPIHLEGEYFDFYRST